MSKDERHESGDSSQEAGGPDGRLRIARFDFSSFFFSGLTGLATFIILAMLAVILGNIIYQGGSQLSWRFISGK